jgi:transcriptional regulator with XRE-family HTH domain
MDKSTNLRDVLANNLKLNRRKCGISQATLAEKAGISTQYIGMIELSRQFPTPEVLERIAGALSIEAYELFAVSPSLENSMERLRQDIMGEIRQVVGEAIEEALAKERKN